MSDYKNVKTMSDAKAGDFRQVNYYFLRKAEEEIADLKEQLAEWQLRHAISVEMYMEMKAKLTAERAKSAKLAEALEVALMMLKKYVLCDETFDEIKQIEKALAEYKAGK